MEGLCRKAPDPETRAFTAAEILFDTNEYGGMYKRGKVYPIQKRMGIVHVYSALKMAADSGVDISAQKLAKEARIGQMLTMKIKTEVDGGEFLRPKKRQKMGVGSLSLEGRDEVKLLKLR
eukprot:309980-Ditylum_brightwellii.AAC.1